MVEVIYEIIQYAVDTGEGPKEETILSFGSGCEDAGRCHGPHTTTTNHCSQPSDVFFKLFIDT